MNTTAALPDDAPLVTWEEAGRAHAAAWHSHSGTPAPRRAVVADDTMPADQAYRLACEGTALVWRGDYHNARQLLQALARRIDRRAARSRRAPPASPAEAFHRLRQAQGRRARILAMLVLPVEPGHVLAHRRAPDVRAACLEALGPATAPYLISLRELQGLVGAHEWRRRGVPVPALGADIHPHYGVFSPVRGEYIDLVAQAPLPPALARDPGGVAFDIGTGTGVLAAVLARRGVPRVVATDLSPQALACARENLERLGLAGRVTLLETDLFPPGRAALVVCNPPWVPARPTSTVEQAVYDPDSRMLRAFLAGVRDHLAPGGEAWLVLSDLAEHLGLRTRAELEAWISAGGLRVLGRFDVRPRHGKARDPDDPLHAARAAEVTSLWRLAAASPP